MQAPFVFQTN